MIDNILQSIESAINKNEIRINEHLETIQKLKNKKQIKRLESCIDTLKAINEGLRQSINIINYEVR
jgi:hypothetical protein